MNMQPLPPNAGHVLIDLKTYLEAHSQVSMRDLSTHFRLPPDALRGMLQHWIRKGKVERHDFAGGCSCGDTSKSTCGACGVEDTFELYEWTGKARSQRLGS